MHRLNLAAKNTERRAGLHFAPIHEKLNYPQRFTDNIEQKITDDLFLIKIIGLGPRRFHRFTEFFMGTCHHFFHAAMISPFENLFSTLVLLVKSTVFLCLTRKS